MIRLIWNVIDQYLWLKLWSELFMLSLSQGVVTWLTQSSMVFIKYRSCTTQLTEFCDSWAISLNNRIRSDVIYLDFAFDSVSHDIILKKLKSSFSIDSYLLQFISNYLKSRKQSVCYWWIWIFWIISSVWSPTGFHIRPYSFCIALKWYCFRP